MKRTAILIANPGEKDDDNFCKGVNVDFLSYKRFLQSPYGGLWDESEIISLHRPSVTLLSGACEHLADSDYGIVVFSGHGYYSEESDSTILVLKYGHEIVSDRLANIAIKQTSVFDCCRQVSKRMPSLAEILEDNIRTAQRLPQVNLTLCKSIYDSQVRECTLHKEVLWSCSIDEKAGDDSGRGGYYSHALLRGAENWRKERLRNGDFSSGVLSVPRAHEIVRMPVVSRRQTPVIEKPRSGPYLPFSVIAYEQ